MLWQRLLFGTLMIIAVVGLIMLDARLSGAPLLPAGDGQLPRAALVSTLLVAALLVLACLEMGRLCRAGGYNPVVIWAAFVTAGLVFVPWIEMHQRLGQAAGLLAPIAKHASPSAVWLAGGVLGSCLAVLGRRTTEKALSNIAVTVLMIAYLGLLGSFVVRIRCLVPGSAGAALMVYFILTVKAGDIGAYFTGMLFGKRKLAPWLSPGKTVEGAVGAVVWGAGAGVLGMVAWPGLLETTAPLKMSQAAIFGVLMAVVGHLGDLVESALKRDVQVKDSGALVPAFGGLLDLIDSPLFAAPIGWLVLTFWTANDYN